MARISHDNLQPGMKLARKLEDRQGRLLIAAGTELTDRHIRSLRLWGITSVDIEDEATQIATGPEKAAPISPEALEAAKALAVKAFCLNTSYRGHPFIKQLLTIYLARLVRQFQRTKNAATVAPAADENPLMLQYADTVAVRRAALNKPSLDELVRATDTVFSLPAIYGEIVKVVNDPRSSAFDVANIISGDTGLTARLLRLVNSAFYGFPGKVDTVTRAITLVGLNELCQLALATSCINVFGHGMGQHVNMPAFWRHSLCCGVVMRLLAGHRREANPERYFVAGLLHDVGRLVILARLPELASEAIRQAQSSNQPLSLMEDAIIGFNHSDVGRELLDSWNLPAGQRQAVARHHTPVDGGEYAIEVAVTHVADVIAYVMRMGSGGEPVVPPVQTQAWDHLGLAPDILPSLVDEAEMQVNDLASVFELDAAR